MSIARGSDRAGAADGPEARGRSGDGGVGGGHGDSGLGPSRTSTKANETVTGVSDDRKAT